MSLLYLLYYIPELGIVDDHAIIEVERYLFISNDMEAVVVFSALVKLLVDAVKLLALGSREVGCVLLHLALLLHQPFYVWQQILGADALSGVGIHAVHIGDALEGSLLRGKEPVDGAVLVHLLVVFPEVLHEIVIEAFAQCSFNEVQVLNKMGISKCNCKPLLKTLCCVVSELSV